MPVPGEEALTCLQGVRTVQQVPEASTWITEPCILGIGGAYAARIADEAGRGPVLGPMVYAAAFAPATLDISKRCFADSKALTAETRDALFKEICEDSQLGYCSEILSAHFITTHMLARSRTSLNALAMDSTMRIIRSLLDQGVNLTQVYVDTVGDASRYSETLSRKFPTLTFTVCPKADALYPIVSAASIVAKVIRDTALELTAKACGVSPDTKLGSGYPGDPDTKAWLKASTDKLWGFKYQGLVRFSWETCTRVMADSGCVGLSWEADEEEGGEGCGGAGGQQQRINFGTKRQADVVESSGMGRHAFFRVRKLQRIQCCF